MDTNLQLPLLLLQRQSHWENIIPEIQNQKKSSWSHGKKEKHEIHVNFKTYPTPINFQSHNLENFI